ncbi:hypothetical protein VNO80_30684 [Phaseolus coccineus]|uniref:Uncharacterized protein n=1 Tax=Phaseolus coccineus TaxID=3886 RepID=A0AAN9QJQ2_PHACN
MGRDDWVDWGATMEQDARLSSGVVVWGSEARQWCKRKVKQRCESAKGQRRNELSDKETRGYEAQPLEHTTAPGGEEPTSRCQTFPSM